ncbi:MAG: LacI family DNA-binding transcriptional regulator [Spirochaetaceae bacterium]|nr:LacI family DNA-binding transcriptional regulator [Spirochaetaceae bacterium]
MNNRLRTTKDSPFSNITIDDIAEKLGISKTTVSRALSGKGRISEETRSRVMACIEECGYRPNHIAKSLAFSKSFNIAVAVPSDAEVNEIPFFQTCLNGIAGTVGQSDYDVIFSVTAHDSCTGLKRLVRNQKVDGVILTRLLTNDKSVEFLKSSGIPFVVIGTSSDPELIQVDSNQEEGCREMTNYLLHQGETDIVLIAGDPEHQVNKDRHKGFCSAVEKSGFLELVQSVYWNVVSMEDTEAVIKKAAVSACSCIVCMDDVICARVLKVLQKLRIRVPEDIRIVSFYDSALMEQYHPPITALHVPIEQLSSKAGELLLDIIDGQEVKKINRVGWELRIRDSSRRL